MDESGCSKTIFQCAGGFVGVLLGSCIPSESGAFVIIGLIAGIVAVNYYWKEYEKEKRRQREREKVWEEQKRREERRLKETFERVNKYPEASKFFYNKYYGIKKISTNYTVEEVNNLLSHSEYEYQRKEEELNAAYRAQKEAQRQAEHQAWLKRQEEERLAAERKRREEELARQRKEAERRNLPTSLPACVASWNTHSFSTLKHKYYYDYYTYSLYKDNATSSMWDTWRTVWHFKNDPSKGVSSYDHRNALQKVINLVEDTLRSTFGSKTEYLTLVCLTASTQRKTELRFKDFAEKVCSDLNMINAYPHIRVVEDGSARHDGGDGSRTVSYDRYFFSGKYVVLFDDVRTSGRSLEQERSTLESYGAKVICAITIAQTTH